MLLLAPRHPERFVEVASLLDSTGLTWIRRTNPPSSIDQTCDAILLDTIGELASIYSLAAVVFVGGSIANKGGHNILEPAAVGAAIITGAHTHNFDGIVTVFAKNEAIIQLPVLSEGEANIALRGAFMKLLADQQGRLELGQRAKHLVEQNQGATECTLDLLDSLIITGKLERPT
jgi:3-deoxy-D-manno-octulosonic-acid transferase